MADSSDPTKKSGRARSLANLRPFPKGVSGNPAGRKPGVRAKVAEFIGEDGHQAFQILWDIATGKIKGTTRDRKDAVTELVTRRFGKVADTQINLEAADLAPGALEDVAPEVVAELINHLSDEPEPTPTLENLPTDPESAH